MTAEFDIVYADPPWRYSFSKSSSREIENQYPTMTVEEICALKVPAAGDSILFLWATAPKLPEALSVMSAWGFSYKTHAVWDKQILGMGYWFRGRHELLLVGTRGRASPPRPEARVASVFSSRRRQHSAKPVEVRNWIDASFPNLRRIELFARNAAPGWSVWGNEVASSIEVRA